MYVADGGFKSAASAKRFCQVVEFSPVAISPDREGRARTPATPVHGPHMDPADFGSSMNNNIE
jgi:hypothetical protein